ncbi:MAG: heme exporter protein CcmD [Hyphomonadaceae bacterium]|nr:heme exporter protein CcmD [Hyphomonadaceae bacterium]
MPHFDKYAPYVLWSYGIAAVVLLGLVAWTLFRITNAKKKLDAVEPKKDDTP